MFLLPWMGWHYSSIIIQTLMMIVFFWFFSLVGFNGIMLAYVLVFLFAHCELQLKKWFLKKSLKEDNFFKNISNFFLFTVIVIFFFLVVYSHFQELSEKEDSKPPNYSIYWFIVSSPKLFCFAASPPSRSKM